MNKQNNIRSATAYITQTQIEHATNWIAQFKQANRYALTRNGIAAGEVIKQYRSTTNFPIGNKAFAQMLFACGFSRIKHNEKVTYILEK